MKRAILLSFLICYSFFGFSQANKVIICHKGKALCVAVEAVATHLNHGDNLGKCSNNKTGSLEEGQTQREDGFFLEDYNLSTIKQ